MAMRYLVRRPEAANLTEIRAQIPNLDEQLGAPDEDLRRPFQVAFTTWKSAVYFFQTRPKGDGWEWICPSLELVAEDETGLFQLLEKFQVPKPQHLAHLN